MWLPAKHPLLSPALFLPNLETLASRGAGETVYLKTQTGLNVCWRSPSWSATVGRRVDSGQRSVSQKVGNLK